MKRVKRGVDISYSKLAIYVVIIVIAVWFLFFSGIFKKNCKQDVECFEERVVECKPTKYINIHNNNIYDYKVIKKSKGNCVIDIKLRRMAIGTDIKLVEKLEGKSMKCYVPIENLRYLKLNEMENLLNFCTGQLKEEIYEIMMEKMYGLLIRNLGGIEEEIKKKVFV